jgi:nitric oxide reductase subunit B
MVLLSLLPVGLIQTWASVEHGYAFARSPELLQQPLLQFFRRMRAPGDVLFAVGIMASVAFIVGFGRRAARPGSLPSPPPGDRAPAPAE